MRRLPDLSTLSREAPIAAWLHRHQPTSRPTVAITFPGTHKAFSVTRKQLPKLRRALERAEAILARPDGSFGSIDLMKGLRDE